MALADIGFFAVAEGGIKIRRRHSPFWWVPPSFFYALMELVSIAARKTESCLAYVVEPPDRGACRRMAERFKFLIPGFAKG
ncbi:hypothetical protein ABIB48_002593 [Arthrobacter sp. UYCu511]